MPKLNYAPVHRTLKTKYEVKVFNIYGENEINKWLEKNSEDINSGMMKIEKIVSLSDCKVLFYYRITTKEGE